MNAAAAAVVRCIPEICIGYGVSDEYSFVFHRSTELFERRARYAPASTLGSASKASMTEFEIANL